MSERQAARDDEHGEVLDRIPAFLDELITALEPCARALDAFESEAVSPRRAPS